MIDEIRQLIGVDFDETTIRLGRFDFNGTLLETIELSTPQPPLPGAVTVTLCDGIESIDPKHEVAFVGVGLPEPISASNTLDKVSVDLFGWHSVPFVDWLEPRLRRKVTLGRHANCALLGETLLGSARGLQNVICFSLGRQIYSGVMVDGSLIVDPHLFDKVSILLEANYSFGSSSNYNESVFLKQELNSFDSPSPCSNGTTKNNKVVCFQDKAFVDSVMRFGREFGAAIAPLLNEVRPEMVLLEGKSPHCSEGSLSLLHKTLSSYLRSNEIHQPKVRTCDLGNDAALLGAAMLANK